jgi:predicted acetylornithine/succinylornithine family transaminase
MSPFSGPDVMTTNAESIQALDAAHVLQTYRRVPITFVRGEGVWLYDAGGLAYLDLLSGIGVTSLGHGHPRLAAAIAEQARTLLHTSNLYHHPLQAPLAARLTALSGLERAFICNSGTEAVEACLKFARRYWHAQGARRAGIVALEHAFHGRTMGSLSVTWDEHYRVPFTPLIPGVTWVSPDDPDALRSAVTRDTAAIILEPIQGERGVYPITPAFAAAVRNACAETGALLIADEVQCGLGRTGECFYSKTLGLEPDLMALGKALGGGVPVGAALVGARVASTVAFGDHASTYGGNPLACRASLVFLEALTDGGLLDHVRASGEQLGRGLDRLARRFPCIVEIRGAGLMRGLLLDRDAAPVVDAALARGLLVNRAGGCVVRLLPPMVITPEEIDQGLERLAGAFADVLGQEAGHGADPNT